MKLKQVFVVMAVVFLLFAVGTGGLDAAIKKGPYLMLNGNSNTEMTVLWQTTVTESCTLEWGPTTAYGNSVNTTEYGTDRQHKYVISGLASGTKYYYRVTIGGVYYTGSFRTAPAASATDAKLFAYADTRSYPANHALVAGKMIDTYTADPTHQTIALFSGDYIYSDTETYWANEFFPRTQANLLKFLSEVPVMPCRGNHESTGTVFAKYYPYPYVANFYYSFDYGPVHVAVVDQNPNASPMISSAQLTWLSNDLASTSKLWKIVCLHSPGWSADGGHENDTEVQDNIHPLCVQYGVSFVFCGDNHYYARAVVDGVNHITTGGGGAPLYTSKPSYPYIVVTEDNYEFCKIDIQGNNLYFNAVDYLGNIIDTVSLYKSTEPTVDANFTYAANLLQVNFTDTSTAQNTTITGWDWNFGDGATSTLQNPTHTYAAAGTYDVSLTVSDGATATDSIIKPVTVVASITYCASSSSSCSNEWISRVLVGTLNNPSGATGYSDFIALVANMTRGASTSFTLTPSFLSRSRTVYWKIWIDYNKNGSFDDAGENVYSGSGKTAKSGSFTVPTSALTGNTRMRVSMSRTAPASCGTLAYGEVEDYTANIL
ncbi:MAG: GEVED domain-containing protein [Candidatus Aminicenantes bacterium]|nr:GEVED domain-containing protein [Candidatus Aminicenantes bacterium]